MKKTSFSKREHLKKDRLIKEVFRQGAPFKGRLVDIYILKRETDQPVKRAAFIVRKRLYNKIVLRNRFRRLMREAYRKTKTLLPGSYDIVITASKIKRHTKSIDLEREIAYVFKKCLKK